jgi:PhnB protein
MRMNPYLTYQGQCEEAFGFYHEILGGKITHMQSHGDSPIADQVPPEWYPLILHARLVVGDVVLMGGDGPPCPDGRNGQGSRMSVTLSLDEVAEAGRIFGALAEGGKIHMPMGQTFWAERSGMCEDRYGIPWIVNGNLAEDAQ